MLGGRGVDIAHRRATLDVHDPGVGVDLDVAHLTEVDHEPVVDAAEAGTVVTGSAHGQPYPVPHGVANGGRDVIDVRAADDHQGTLVDHPVVELAAVVVEGVVSGDDLAGHRSAQCAQDGGSIGRGHDDLPFVTGAVRWRQR